MKEEIDRLNDWVDGLKTNNHVCMQEIANLASKIVAYEKFVKNAQK